MISSKDEYISDIMKSIDDGLTQLPDFQRGWVWEDSCHRTSRGSG